MTPRPSRDSTGLSLAAIWARRGTCARRQVGCVLFDKRGVQLASGYNGAAPQQPHCTDTPCKGIGLPSGQGLELCEAIHAEQNALLQCADISQIETCYVTHSPCVHCVKMLLRSSTKRIVFTERYAHDQAARELWEKAGRVWVCQSDQAPEEPKIEISYLTGHVEIKPPTYIAESYKVRRSPPSWLWWKPVTDVTVYKVTCLETGVSISDMELDDLLEFKKHARVGERFDRQTS